MLLALAVSACFAQQVFESFAGRDVPALEHLAAAATTREDSLLARYRLYPLTGDRRWIDGLPTDLREASGREFALLSSLWAWYIPGSAPWNVVRYGRRAGGLLDRALAEAPHDPLVRLIEAQSLLFRPGIAGGDVGLAIARLRVLRDELADGNAACGTSAAEVGYWLWFAMRRTGDPGAADERRALEAAVPPPLFRTMLDSLEDRHLTPR